MNCRIRRNQTKTPYLRGLTPPARLIYIIIVAAGTLIPTLGCNSQPASAPPGAPTTVPETSVELPKDATVPPHDSTPPTKPAAAGTSP
jgi:hypothetical protein